VWCVSDVPPSGDEDDLARFGSAICKMADIAVITPEDGQSDAAHRLHWMLAGIGPAGHVTISRNRLQAIDAAIRSAGPDDEVLVVGTCGGLPIDRAIARSVLEKAAREQHARHAFSA
jgi:UDP-N-acetylmuramyl tripeptide synthase